MTLPEAIEHLLQGKALTRDQARLTLDDVRLEPSAVVAAPPCSRRLSRDMCTS